MSSKAPAKKKTVPLNGAMQSVDHFDDITHIFLATSGIIATTLHIATPTAATTTLNPIKIVTKSKSAFLEKYQQLMRDGPSQLKIVSDFDFTLTKYLIFNNAGIKESNSGDLNAVKPQVNPIPKDLVSSSMSAHVTSQAMDRRNSYKSYLRKGITCHSVLEDSQLFGNEYQTNAVKTFQKYYPIEMDAHISYEKKFQYMMEWTKEIQNLLIHKAHLTKASIDKAVADALEEKRIAFRDHALTFLEAASQIQVPILVFSGSISDVVVKLFEKTMSEETLANITVFANQCSFDETGEKLVSFKEPLVHAFNKKASTFLASSPYFHSEEEATRNNVILFGDGAKDILMVNGMKYEASKMLKVGFLNDKISDKFDSFLSIYDIVIIGDEAGFEVPLEILRNICNVDGANSQENVNLQEEIRLMQPVVTSSDYDATFSPQNEGYNLYDGFEPELDVADYGNYV